MRGARWTQAHDRDNDNTISLSIAASTLVAPQAARDGSHLVTGVAIAADATRPDAVAGWGDGQRTEVKFLQVATHALGQVAMDLPDYQQMPAQ